MPAVAVAALGVGLAWAWYGQGPSNQAESLSTSLAPVHRALMGKYYIDELFDATAVQAHDVIMVGTLVELEHRHAVLEMMARDQTRSLELRQHPIHRRQADVLAQIDESPLDVLGRHMPIDRRFENLEDFDARRGDLETRLAKIVAFHVAARPLR